MRNSIQSGVIHVEHPPSISRRESYAALMRGSWGSMLVLGLVVVASTVGAAAQESDRRCPIEIDGENGDDSPGQQLAGVVGEQQSVVARELERRGFNATLENASGPRERATVIDAELDRIDAKMTVLEDCQGALVTARQSGTLSAEEFREQTATLESEIEDVSERLNRTETAAADLRDRLRQRQEIGPDRFEDLETRVDRLETFVDEPERVAESSGEGANEPDSTDGDEGLPSLTADGSTDSEESTTEPEETTTEEPTETTQEPSPTADSQTTTPAQAPDEPEQPTETGSGDEQMDCRPGPAQPNDEC